MNVDNFHKIGYTHDECQDYSLSRNWDSGMSFIAVADGCSESHDRCRLVDVGARILALSAEKTVRSLLKKRDISYLYDNFFKNGNQYDLGSLIQECSKETIHHIIDVKDSEYVLDSTLLFCVADENKAIIYVFGDGIVAIDKNNGDKDYYSVGFQNGAPFYLSYCETKGRLDRYNQVKNNLIIQDLNDNTLNTKCKLLFNPNDCKQYYSWSSIYVEDYKNISIMSDGFTSFESSDREITSAEIVNQVVDYKSPVGVFVQRRMKGFLRKNKDLKHYDDISIASITKG